VDTVRRHSWAARSAAGEGLGEGFPLPKRNDGSNRRAIRTINPREERPAWAGTIEFGVSAVVDIVRGALPADG